MNLQNVLSLNETLSVFWVLRKTNQKAEFPFHYDCPNSSVRSDIHENHRNAHVRKLIVLLNRCFPMYNLFLFLNKSVDKLWDLNN